MPPQLRPEPWIGTTARASFAKAWNNLEIDLPLYQRFRTAIDDPNHR